MQSPGPGAPALPLGSIRQACGGPWRSRDAQAVAWRLLTGLGLLSLLIGTSQAAASDSEGQISAAVLPFRAPAADKALQPLGVALADMLATDLGVARELRLIERERLGDLRKEHALGASGQVDRATAARAGKLVGADLLIVGALTVAPPTLRIDARAVSTTSGEIVASASAEGAIDSFFAVEAELASKLLQALGAALPPLVRLRIGKGQPQKLGAALAYGRGLDALDRGDRAGAKTAFAEALAADAGFVAARRRLDALEQRVEALEARTAAVEVAGGRIMRPVSTQDHWYNAGLARSRGDERAALADLRAVLAQRPEALEAIAMWIALGGGDAGVPTATLPLLRSLRATERGDVDAALRASAQLLAAATGPRRAGTPALAVAARWARLRALQVAEPSRRSAEEWQELALLALERWPDAEAAPEASPWLSGAAREEAARAIEGLRRWVDADIAPRIAGAAAQPRHVLLARPVAVAFPERVGRSMPWLAVHVRVAEATTSGLTLRILASGPAAAEVSLQPTLVTPAPWPGEATLWTAELDTRAWPGPGPWRVTIERQDARGRPVRATLWLQPPTVWGGNWRALGQGIGRWRDANYPHAGVAVQPLLARPGSAMKVLIDAAASVWLRHTEEEREALNVQPLWAAVPGPAAAGVARYSADPGSGSVGIGLRLPLFVLRAGEGGGEEVLALGSLWIERRFDAKGGWLFRSGARAGWTDGPLDGSDAPLDVEIAVAAALAAQRPDLARLAFLLAADGVAGARPDARPETAGSTASPADARALWLRQPMHRAALALLQRHGQAPWSNTAALLASHEPPIVETEAAAAESAAPGDDVGAWLDLALAATATTSTRHGASARQGVSPAPPASAMAEVAAAPVRSVAAGPGWRLDVDPVSVDAYQRCVDARVCPPAPTDRCHERGPAGHGDQPAQCLPVSVNPYPATWLRKSDAMRYCAFIGGQLPSAAAVQAAARQHTDRATGRLPPPNAEDALRCGLSHVGRDPIPASCMPPASRSAMGFDHHTWLAPTGWPQASPFHGLRFWLADGERAIAGCGPTEVRRGGAACVASPTELVGLAAFDVGIRCLRPEGRAAPPARAVVAPAPPLRWLPVRAGRVHLGKPPARPTLTLTLPGGARGAVDDAAVAALCNDVPGLTVATLRPRLLALQALGLQGTLSAGGLEELFGRARWVGLDPMAELDGLVQALRDQTDAPLERLGLAVGVERLQRQRARAVAKQAAEAAAPAGTPSRTETATVAQSMLESILLELSREGGETPKPKEAMVFHNDQPLLCDDRAPATCEDPTGSASNRLTMRMQAGRQVEVSAFEMLETEVTQTQLRARLGLQTALHPCDACPAERVTWQEADAFCRAVGGQLPTEAQWVRAARGDGTALRSAPLAGLGWSRIDSGLRARSAGSAPGVGPFGHRDLLGSVWEWAADGWEDSYGFDIASRPVALQAEVDRATGLPTGRHCVASGGSLRSVEARVAAMPWQPHPGHGSELRLCDVDADALRARITAALQRDPQGPPHDPDERRRQHPLLGGSYGSDERLVHAASRVGYGARLRSPFVGFRCVRPIPGR